MHFKFYPKGFHLNNIKTFKDQKRKTIFLFPLIFSFLFFVVTEKGVKKKIRRFFFIKESTNTFLFLHGTKNMHFRDKKKMYKKSEQTFHF